MKVSDRMTGDAITVQADDPIRVAMDLIDQKQLRRFPVMKDGDLVGIVTDRDLRNTTASSVVLTEKKYHDFLLDNVKIESIMSANPRTVSPQSDLKDAARLILEIKVGGLPVLQDGRLVGIITETDLIDTLLEQLPDD
ncbi:MAG TPA: CBS domain-containing protein [Candidatus Anoxymicrobiaceae bacterium]